MLTIIGGYFVIGAVLAALGCRAAWLDSTPEKPVTVGELLTNAVILAAGWPVALVLTLIEISENVARQPLPAPGEQRPPRRGGPEAEALPIPHEGQPNA